MAETARTGKPAAKFGTVARVLKAVAHPQRLAIIEMLQGRDMCVNEICDALGAKQAMTSQHLNLMRDRGILTCRREGGKVYYAIGNTNVIKLLQCVYSSCDAGQVR